MSDQPSLSEAFELSDWRRGVKERRELVRSLIRHAVTSQAQLEHLVEDLKRRLRFSLMDDADKNLLHVTFHDMRTIVGRWNSLDPIEQDAFLNGAGAPSSLAKALRKGGC